MKRNRNVVCVLALVYALFATPSRAQVSLLPLPQNPEVELGEAQGHPGGSVMVPLSLTPGKAGPLGTLTLEIEYVSNSVMFDKVSLALAMELADAQLQANVSEGKPNDKGLPMAKLKAVASLKVPAPKEGLPEGVLGYLVFQIKDTAKPFTIKLTPLEIAAEDISKPPKKVAGVVARPGAITIEIPHETGEDIAPELNPEVGCFFFTH